MTSSVYDLFQANRGKVVIASSVAILLVIMLVQSKCGKQHDQNALVGGTVADTKHEEIKPLLEKIEAGKLEVSKMQAEADRWKAKYMASKNKLGPTLPEAQEFQVKPEDMIPPDTRDITGVLEALQNCDGALRASEGLTVALKGTLATTEQALAVSQAEAAARAKQAQELGKSLAIEKAKGWQKYAYAIGGAATVWLIKH